MSAPFRGLIYATEQEAGSDQRLSRFAIYALLGLSVVALGFNWPVMALALDSITPIWMACLRVVGAGVAVAIVGSLTGNVRLPPRQDLPLIASVAVFRLAAVMVLVFTALTLVPAGRASVLVWTTSLWTVPIAAVFLGEAMTPRRWIGLTVGVTGVLVLSGVWSNDWRDPDVAIGTALLLFAALVNASTAVHIRGHRWSINPLQALPWQLFGAAVPLAIFGLFVDGVPSIEWTPGLVGNIAYQALVVSGLAFWAQIVVLRNLDAVSTNLTMMGVPVIGVLSSAVVLGEPITASLAVGMTLVLTGVGVNLLSDRGVPSRQVNSMADDRN